MKSVFIDTVRNEKLDKIDKDINSLKGKFEEYEKKTIYKSKIEDLYYILTSSIIKLKKKKTPFEMK